MSITITIAKSSSIFTSIMDNYGTDRDLEIIFSNNKPITLKGKFPNGITRDFPLNLPDNVLFGNFTLRVKPISWALPDNAAVSAIKITNSKGDIKNIPIKSPQWLTYTYTIPLPPLQPTRRPLTPPPQPLPLPPPPQPVDCQVTWSDWSTECDKDGYLSRRITNKTDGKNGGATCPPSLQKKRCPPVNCNVGDWGSWSVCDKDCGVGNQYRTRIPTQQALYGGSTCPPLTQKQDCNTQNCPVDCKVDWGNWSTCENDTETQKGTISRYADFGGSTCPPSSSLTRSRPCPLILVVQSGTSLDEIREKFPNNTVEQVRNKVMIYGVINTLQLDGFGQLIKVLNYGTSKITKISFASCQNLVQVPPLPSTVTDCSRMFYDCQNFNQNIGDWNVGNVTNMSEMFAHAQNFNNGDEPVRSDKPLNSWNVGNVTNMYQMFYGAVNFNQSLIDWDINKVQNMTQIFDATPMSPYNIEMFGFNKKNVDCVVGDFSGWSECSVKCGGGTQSRSRPINQNSRNLGKPCPPLIENQPCNTQTCAPVDCQVNWSTWSPCYPPCGGEGGTRTRTGKVTDPLYGGATCPPLSSLTQTEECNNPDKCPIDCIMGDWGWSNCDKNCGGGFQTATRIPIQRAEYGGAECPVNVTSRPCNTNECPFTFTVKITNPGTEIYLPIGLNMNLNKDFIIRTTFQDYKINYKNWEDLDLNVCPAKAREDLINNVPRRICPTIDELTKGITGTPESNFNWISGCEYMTENTCRGYKKWTYREGVWVDWGDRTIAKDFWSIYRHTYTSIGDYTIHVYGGSNYEHNLKAIESIDMLGDASGPSDYHHKKFGFTETGLIARPSLTTNDNNTRNSIIRFDSYGSFVLANAASIYDINFMRSQFPNLVQENPIPTRN